MAAFSFVRSLKNLFLCKARKVNCTNSFSLDKNKFSKVPKYKFIFISAYSYNIKFKNNNTLFIVKLKTKQNL